MERIPKLVRKFVRTFVRGDVGHLGDVYQGKDAGKEHYFTTETPLGSRRMGVFARKW